MKIITNAKPEATLASVQSGAKAAAWSFQGLGIAFALLGGLLHFHFHQAMEALERGAPDLAAAFLMARHAELSAIGVAVFFVGFCLFVLGFGFHWLALSASAQLAHARSLSASSSGSSPSNTTPGA